MRNILKHYGKEGFCLKVSTDNQKRNSITNSKARDEFNLNTIHLPYFTFLRALPWSFVAAANDVRDSCKQEHRAYFKGFPNKLGTLAVLTL